MNRKGFSLVEIMVVVAILGTIAAIAIPNLLQARVTANAAGAKANVRSLSTAAETFSINNNGNYPTSVAELAGFISSAGSYCGQTVQGYTYTCTLASTGYTISAAPATAQNGGPTYTATTGGALTPL